MHGMRQPFTLDHFSDTHLGFRQYPVMSGSGRNQREQDFSRSFLEVVTRISEANHPLVVHAGDFFDNPRPTWRHVMQAMAGAKKITENGSILVVAAGNHDAPADANEACPVDVLEHVPGVYVSSNKYRVIDLSEDVAAGRARPELDKVAIHLLPHEALKTVNWDDVMPLEGYTNILVSHCVVGDTSLYRRSVGREYNLPAPIIARGWDYVALGHYHKQGPVAVAGLTENTTPAWYAGSTENNGFSDVRDGKKGGSRGYLEVGIDPHETVPQVTPVDLPIRAMFRLPTIDAAGMGHAEVTEAMVANAKEADVRGAVVRQVIIGLHPDTWGQVDVNAARDVAKDALWYEAKPEFITLEVHAPVDDDGRPNTLGDIAVVLETTLTDLFGSDHQRDEVSALARKLLGSALTPVTLVDDCCHDTSETDHNHETGATVPTAEDGVDNAAAPAA